MKRALLVFAAALVLISVVPLSNLLLPKPSGVLAVGAEDATLARAAHILESKCLDCHSRAPRLPLYAALPIASGLVAKDRADGLRAYDLPALLGPDMENPVGEVALAKLEHSVARDTMPPARYTALHWGARITAEERGELLAWIRRTRAEHYASGIAAAPHADAAVQPLGAPAPLDPAKVALGNQLFHDVRLSGDNTVSCASCHALDKGGTDQLPTSIGVRGQVGPINSPTVFNAVFHVRQFWDGRAADLQEQAAGPVTNPLEMDADWDAVLAKLRADAAFTEAFLASYDTLSVETVTDAIATFEATLVTPNSAFDRYLAGHEDALTPEALAGYRHFQANACATCHVGVALGGQSFEYMGHRRDYFADRGNVQEADLGRFNFTGDAGDRHKFKVPSLRNIALTWPYFHDASAGDLTAAVDTMARYNAPRPFTPTETAQVVAFLESLTGEYNGVPLQ